MAVDHGLTYRQFRLRNVPHWKRLRDIMRCMENLRVKPSPTYADCGCSNGYLTSRIAEVMRASYVVGFDHNEENLTKARQSYPNIEFQPLDLNLPAAFAGDGFDLVTCFETLEHVGRTDTALKNLMSMVRPGGMAVISVPIEVGGRGIGKFLAKTLIYRYSLAELDIDAPAWWRYFMALMRGERISRFRDVSRTGWGTHFGFDYRDIDDWLSSRAVSHMPTTRGFARFYVLEANAKLRQG